ncbi:MAG: DUF4112 domain-containing protein [Halobacteria archaeon]|nr:DUF4112 domain-containing protein [Halobacteria archaeon]
MPPNTKTAQNESERPDWTTLGNESDESPALRRVEVLSYVLDNSIRIPGTRYRIGLDPIIGLLPGIGDTAGSVLSAYIVLESARLGASLATLSRMVINILVESVLGSLPLVGDVFDAVWKANERNMNLLESHLEKSEKRKRRDALFIVVLIGVLGVLVILNIILTFIAIFGAIRLLGL